MKDIFDDYLKSRDTPRFLLDLSSIPYHKNLDVFQPEFVGDFSNYIKDVEAISKLEFLKRVKLHYQRLISSYSPTYQKAISDYYDSLVADGKLTQDEFDYIFNLISQSLFEDIENNFSDKDKKLIYEIFYSAKTEAGAENIKLLSTLEEPEKTAQALEYGAKLLIKKIYGLQFQNEYVEPKKEIIRYLDIEILKEEARELERLSGKKKNITLSYQWDTKKKQDFKPFFDRLFPKTIGADFKDFKDVFSGNNIDEIKPIKLTLNNAELIMLIDILMKYNLITKEANWNWKRLTGCFILTDGDFNIDSLKSTKSQYNSGNIDKLINPKKQDEIKRMALG